MCRDRQKKSRVHDSDPKPFNITKTFPWLWYIWRCHCVIHDLYFCLGLSGLLRRPQYSSSKLLQTISVINPDCRIPERLNHQVGGVGSIRMGGRYYWELNTGMVAEILSYMVLSSWLTIPSVAVHSTAQTQGCNAQEVNGLFPRWKAVLSHSSVSLAFPSDNSDLCPCSAR